MVVVTILVGLLIGTLVGISGMGGAVMLLPLLIVVLKVPPLIAVGSDAVFAAFTKIGASTVHAKQGSVDLKMVLFLAIGSLPGALVGFKGLSLLHASYGPGIDGILRTLIGMLLIAIPIVMLAQIRLLRKRENDGSDDGDDSVRKIQTITVGLVGGLLVGLTSVGSGSIILVGLLLTYRRPPAQLVGTDIVHAILLTGLTGALHYSYLNSVDLSLVGLLLVGSIPGALIGAKLSTRVPANYLQIGLLVMLLLTGIYLIST